MENIVLIATLSVLIMISPFFSRISGFPIAVTEILLGSVAAYAGLFTENGSLLTVIAKVGFLYLMFLAGMEVNLREFGAIKKTLLQRALLYFVILYSLSFSLYLFMDLSPIYIAALPIVSLGMIMALIHDYGREEPWLNLALTIGIIGELISIAALTVLSGSVQFGLGLEFVGTMLTLLLFLLAVVAFFKGAKVLFWWFPEVKRRIMPDDNSHDQDVRVSMALFFVLVAAMLYLNLEVVLGAFVAGMFIASFFEHKADLPEKLNSFGFGFLVPIFFIYVGTTFNLASLGDPVIVIMALMIVFGMVGIRLVSSFIAYRGILGSRNTLLFALGDSMPLTFLVAVATIGLSGELLSKDEYSAFILASMIEAIFIMLIIKLIHAKNTGPITD
ncbi:MAG: cation:proton antiporter [Campylobacterales bacterium]